MFDDDILTGLTTDADKDRCPSTQELFYTQADIETKLRKTKKKLKKAKKSGKNQKKLKRKYKSLKQKYEMLSTFLQNEKKTPVKGRWDTTIEKSMPEFIKLATVIIDRKLPPGKGSGKNG